MKKTAILLSALALSASGAVFAAGDHQHGHDHKPLHGGVVAEASDIDFELVADAGSIALFVRDHGKPASTQDATAKVTLLNGTEKTEAVLAPAGGNKLAAQGAYKLGAGTKAVATVTLAGKKPVSVRFAIR